MAEIILRPGIIPEDAGFVFSSWLKSYYGNSPHNTWIPKKIYQKEQAIIITKLLNRSDLSIAAMSEDERIIIGYLVYEKGIIHYVYIKEPFRGLGIGKKLIQENGFFDKTKVTHLTHKGRKIQLKAGFIYSPYIE